MRLLIVTQAVDTDDPVLGFFVRWIEEFSKHADRIEVICLKEGKHNFYSAKNAVPRSENSEEFSGTGVRVYSLGKERGAASRGAYAWRFLSLIWKLRRDYDAVFVHMNPEYVVLGGPLWWVWSKRVALWYTHKSVNLKLRIAALFSDVIFSASKESFRLKNKKLHIIGHGIDTNFFAPDASVVRTPSFLSVGRLTKSKRHDLAIRAAADEGKELRIAGEGPERDNLKAFADKLGARVLFLGGLQQAQLRDEYRKASLLIHTSETGSLDKVVLEALACGLPIRTNDPALKRLEGASPAYIREHHSLARLIPAILDGIRRL
jgi:glycosyltransferase involved in cell wall biosynthesis